MKRREQTGENRAFMEMMKAAREWLAGREPETVCSGSYVFTV